MNPFPMGFRHSLEEFDDVNLGHIPECDDPFNDSAFSYSMAPLNGSLTSSTTFHPYNSSPTLAMAAFGAPFQRGHSYSPQTFQHPLVSRSQQNALQFRADSFFSLDNFDQISAWNNSTQQPLAHVVPSTMGDMYGNRFSPTQTRRSPQSELWDSSNELATTDDESGRTRTSASSPTNDDETWEPEDIRHIGYQDAQGNWRCNYDGCTSSRIFTRACDLRKHYRSHQKTYFCKDTNCPRFGIGFANRKDWERHRNSHKPSIRCMQEGCERLFSRKDNMREHYKKIHQRPRNNLFPRQCRRRTQAAQKAPTTDVQSW